MTWLLIATGFSGAFSFLFIFKKISHFFTTPKAIAVHFSPAGGCAEALINEIHKARHEILVQAYSLLPSPFPKHLSMQKKRRKNRHRS